MVSTLTYRQLTIEDGPRVFDLVRTSGSLDVNSRYTYLLLGKYFASTSLVVESEEGPVGCVLGFRPPERPDTLFVWQVAVHPQHRRHGLARKLIHLLLDSPGCSGATHLEATVTPDNDASDALFRGIARAYGADCQVEPCFAKRLFSDGDHEPEHLYRIGPLRERRRRSS